MSTYHDLFPNFSRDIKNYYEKEVSACLLHRFYTNNGLRYAFSLVLATRHILRLKVHFTDSNKYNDSTKEHFFVLIKQRL